MLSPPISPTKFYGGYPGASYTGTPEELMKTSYPYYPGYEITEKIGGGFFGSVYKAVRRDGKTVALKVIKVKDEKELQTVKREVEIMKKIGDPSCRPFLACILNYQYIQRMNEVLIEMEMVEGVTLDEYFPSDISRKPRDLVLIMKDIVKAIKYLHQNGIIHNDIKPNNIIISKDLTPVLVDFGSSCLSTTVCQEVSEGCCTGIYGPIQVVSPETVKSNYYFYESDVWSLGVAFFIAATDRHPFNGSVGQQIIESIKTSEPLQLNTTDETLNYIVNRALVKKIKARITLEEIEQILSNYE